MRKKEAGGQSKLEAFINKKNCTRKENKPDVINLQSSTEEAEVPLEVYSRGYLNHEPRTKLHSFPFVLIGPGDIVYYQSIIKAKMVRLFENYNPEEARRFIKGNMHFHNVSNVENLLKMEVGTMFWNVSLFELLSFLIENIHCISSNVRLLVEEENQIVELTRKQILAILGSMFFGIMPKQYEESQTSFGGLMECSERGNLKLNCSKIQKLKCVASYFSCMMDCKQKNSHLLNETVRFRRSNINSQSQSLLQQQKPMKNIEVMSLSETKIQDHYCEGIMVDFANKRLGGGVLGHGCIQEEILFSIFPELIAAKLICFQLHDAEAVIVQGARKFSYYSGYKETFKFEGSCFEDLLHKDHERSIIVAIDAYDFSLHKQSRFSLDQYSKKGVRRQLAKALAGFKETLLFVDDTVPVVTGRWGCGAFRGDEDIKFIIQWLACSLSNRKMIYITSDPTQQKEYGCLSRQFKNQSSTQMLNILEKYFVFRSKLFKKQSLINYIKHEVIL